MDTLEYHSIPIASWGSMCNTKALLDSKMGIYQGHMGSGKNYLDRPLHNGENVAVMRNEQRI